MHRSIAAWLTEHPLRAALACVACGVLSQVLPPLIVFAAAIPVLVTLRHDARLALGSAIAGAVATGGGALTASDPTIIWVGVGFVSVYLSALLLAQLLKRTGSLNLCFQVAVLGSAAMIIAVHLALSDPVGAWTPILNQLADSMAAAGVVRMQDRASLVALWSNTMWGALGALALLVVFGSLLVGRWWQALLQSPGGFGMEYRRLRLGTTLGIAITGVLVAAYASGSPLLSSLAWIALAALTFQGLAAAHRSKASGRLNRGWLAAIYVLLVVAGGVTVFVLAIWGFADNWLRPRAQNV